MRCHRPPLRLLLFKYALTISNLFIDIVNIFIFLDNTQDFARKFLEDKLHRSEPPVSLEIIWYPLSSSVALRWDIQHCVPLLQAVKIVVGNNFDEIVLDESKHVVLVVRSWQIYIWEKTFIFPQYNDIFWMQIYERIGQFDPYMDACNKLTKYLCGINSLLVAKMDGTANWHPRARKVCIASCIVFSFLPPAAFFK